MRDWTPTIEPPTLFVIVSHLFLIIKGSVISTDPFLFLEDLHMAMFEWLSNFFESLTVVGWGIFVVAVISYLFASALYVMRHGGEREAWFVVLIVGVFLALGLRYGIPKSTELLAQGISGSLVWVPEIQKSVREAFDMVEAPWTGDASSTPQPTLTITEGDVTIVSTSGIPTPAPDIPTSTPEAPTPTLPGEIGGIDLTGTLTPEDIATIVAIQQMTATYTPRPPTAEAEPTLDMEKWNPQTPAPTRAPGG